MPDGSVILVEIARETLTRVMPDGKQHVIAKLGGGPNGAAMGPNGKIYVCNNGGFNWIERPDGRLFPARSPASTRPARSRWSIPRPASSRRCTSRATAAS
jgi:gluconolactonase